VSNINFICPYCSFQKQLPASAEGMQGNCPSCKAVVTIRADAPANPAVLPQQPLPQQQSVNPNLSQCKDCGSMISRNATTCPHCGAPNPSILSGVLVVRRLKRKLFFAAKPSIWLGDNKIGQLKNGESIRVSVPPGEHILTIGVEQLTINFVPAELPKHCITISPNRETIVEFAVDKHGLAKDLSVKTC
jgi:hypothetical protein